MPSRPCSPRLRPFIAELLRTCVYPPSLLLRVEKIIVEEIKRVGADNEENHSPKRAYRLWLGDGELMVQAVLASHLHQAFKSDEITEGSLLDLKRFRVRRGKRKHGGGEVVYLAITDYESVFSAKPAPSAIDLDNEGGFIREESQSPPAKKRKLNSPGERLARIFPPPKAMRSITSSQESDGFETVEVDQETISRRRRALHELSSNAATPAKEREEYTGSPHKRRRLLDAIEASGPAIRFFDADESGAMPSTAAAFAPAVRNDLTHPRPPSSNSSSSVSDQQRHENQSKSHLPPPHPPSAGPIQPTLPLHTLSSLLHPPPSSPLPSRNYICTIFAIVSWVSSTLSYPRKNSPFPPKRHIKIHDSSITSRYSGITLAVYEDAANFKPVVGTIAFFRGVVMQRWEEEIILNAYARKGRAEQKEGNEEWFVSDEEVLVGMGFDVQGMKEWWEERKKVGGKPAQPMA